MTALPAAAVSHCKHCGAAVEGDAPYCCAGCEMAAEIIAGAGLDRYYDERAVPAPRPGAPIPALDLVPVETRADGTAECRLAIDGLRCASCVWVTEKVLERTPGVKAATVSYGTGRARIVFDPAAVDVGAIGQRIAALGYRPRPANVAPTGEHDRELLVRLGVAAFSAMNVMLLSAGLYAGWFDGMDERFAALFRWTSLALATPAALWCATPFFAGALQGLRHRVLHMDAPVSLGILILYVEGVVATVLGHDTYLDSMTMLVTLLLAGRVLESRGRKRAREAAELLAASLPRVARRVTPSGGLETVSVRDLVPGDRLDVGAGEEVGADGVVDAGSGLVRMAMLTGESEPAPVRAGDAVVAGAVLADGALRVRVTATGGQTLIERMAEDLRRATDRGTAKQLPDRIAPFFTAATLVVATLTFAGWAAWGGLVAAVPPTVAVLVVACPCALALAQPLAVAQGLASSARRGLLLRSGDTLLSLADVDVVALDKTGTVTGGEPVVVAADDRFLRLAAGLERYSVHPVARAIVEEAIRRGIPLPTGVDVEEKPGDGIRGRVDGRAWHVRPCGPGRLEVIATCPGGQGLAGADLRGRQRPAGGTIADADRGEIVLRDAVRPDARKTVDALRELGLRVALLTGDHPDVAARIAAEAGVDEVVPAMKPQDKAAWIEARRAEGHRVLFAGDGVNDGPALAAADVAVAMGSGAATSVLVADGVVAEQAVLPVAVGLRAGRAARTVITGNMKRSIAYNVLAVTAAALGFVNPLVAAVLMPLSSSMVVWGALGVERRVARAERPAASALATVGRP